MNYCIGLSRTNKERNAGAKAPDDIIKICTDMNMKIFLIPAVIGKKNFFQKLFWNIFIPFIFWSILYIKLKRGDKILLQHPLVNNIKALKFFIPIIKSKGVKVIALIHDLCTLRESNDILDSELKILNLYDVIISHNAKMSDVLNKKGITFSKIVDLEIFDYILPSNKLFVDSRERDNSIVIAGNLDPIKCSYITKLIENNKDLKINLYGDGFKENNSFKNIHYFGSFPPEKLVDHITGDFGLIWDGDSIDKCDGLMGEYLKYNNPHKTSLFITCNLPIIVWEKAAIAHFIRKHNIGIIVNDLNDLNNKLSNITNEDYREMKKNIQYIAELVNKGEFTKAAIKKSVTV